MGHSMWANWAKAAPPRSPKVKPAATSVAAAGAPDKALRLGTLAATCPIKVARFSAQLALTLLCAFTWFCNFLRLALFSMLLLPAFLTFVWGYFFDRRIMRGVRFDDGSRCTCDIYMPAEAVAAKDGQGPPVPVVIAVMGGAWTIGYKAWNAQLGLRLMDAGVLTVAVDYRNFPAVQVPGMVEDLGRGVAWVFANIHKYGGDPNNMVLTGQSAGAHLSSLLLLKQCSAEAAADIACAAGRGEGAVADADEVAVLCQENWSVGSLRGYVGISGAYDLEMLGARLRARRLGDGLLRAMCPGGDLASFSPRQILDSSAWRGEAHKAARRLPPIRIYHGGRDKTIPAASSEEFVASLQAAGATDALVDVQPDLAHAEVVIEGPMRGEDHQVKWLLPLLLGSATEAKLEAMRPLRPLLPQLLFTVASRIMPF